MKIEKLDQPKHKITEIFMKLFEKYVKIKCWRQSMKKNSLWATLCTKDYE